MRRAMETETRPSNLRTNPLTPEENFESQAERIGVKKTISVTRKRASLMLLFLFILFTGDLLALVLTNSIEKCNCESDSRNASNLTSRKNGRTFCGNNSLSQYEYLNCEHQFDLAYNLRVSACKREDYGKILDVRLFINNHPSIKGIGIPFTSVPRLRSILTRLM